MSDAFRIPASAFSPEERMRLNKQRAGSKGGRVKNERNDPKSAAYIKPNAFTIPASAFSDEERRKLNHSYYASKAGTIRAEQSPVKVTKDWGYRR